MAPFKSSTISFSSLWLLLFLPFSSVTSQTNTNNISLGSSLTTESKSLWSSPSGEFAFGFRQITANAYLLAIVFAEIPDRTVVWSANRNNLVPAGSKLDLTAEGRLLLTDPSGNQIWTGNANGPTASHAAMLDSGNFVLAANDSSRLLWESFLDPTDTLLPTQTLEGDSQLVASRSMTNHSEGRFQLIMQGDGYLVMYQRSKRPEQRSEYAYWAVQNPSFGRVLFNESGSLQLVSSNGTVLRSVFNNSGSGDYFYRRVTFDYDGVLRYYEYPKRNDSAPGGGVWPMKWKRLYFEPPNICTAIGGTMGSGACGYNSYCELETDQYRKCKCPPRYVFLDPSDEEKGCIPDFAPVDCRLPEENRAFDLAAMPKVNWPQSDYETFQSETEDECQQYCLSDCRCVLAAYGNNGRCWLKKSPLSNGGVEDMMTVKTLIKVRRSNSTTTTTSFSPPVYRVPEEKKRKGKAFFVIGSVLLGISGFIIVLAATTFLLLSRRKKKKENQVTGGETAIDGKNDWLSRNLYSFSYSQLEVATGGFKEVLGSGASGTVYKGVLAGDQRLVAVKRLDKEVSGGAKDLEFEVEVKVIGGANHKNLVKLVGFCNEGLHRILVYEFMYNGSLAGLLFGGGNVRVRPSWYTRTEIACAVAGGLVYLHEECSTQIIHCDVKPQNILLDESMTAKISDFGLAKLLKVDQTRTMTGIRGTKGYVAPEWFRNMPVTTKVDVYSFGILLLELVSCRSKLEMEVESEDEVILADWAYECYREGQLHRLVENDDEAMANMGKVERYVKVAIWCIQDDPSLRPKMKKVIHMLEGSVHVSVPPDPASFISTIN